MLCPLFSASSYSHGIAVSIGTYLARQQAQSQWSAAGSPTGGRSLLHTYSPHRLCAWLGRRPKGRGLYEQGDPQSSPYSSCPAPASPSPCPSPCHPPRTQGNLPAARSDRWRLSGTGPGTRSRPLGVLRGQTHRITDTPPFGGRVRAGD